MSDTLRLCSADEVEPGTAKRFDVGGHRIALVRIDDDFYAIGDRCSHEDFSLSEGEVIAEECEIECWKHGSTFSLTSGEPQSLPAVKPVPVYDVVREGDDVLVKIFVTTLEIRDLQARVPGRDILRGIDLTVSSGEVHAVMGPNGSGKSTLSHVLMGRPGYEVTGGSVTLDGQDILSLSTWERAQAGLFLSMQYPIEVPGVSLVDALEAAFTAAPDRDPNDVRELVTAEATRIGIEPRFLLRPLNVDLSGGERKRNETLQLGVLRPRIAVLDEIDSGLDIDALRMVARRVEAATAEDNLGVLAITHYSRLLHELKPDVIHVLSGGRIVASGGPELAAELEQTGYAPYGGDPGDTPALPEG